MMPLNIKEGFEYSAQESQLDMKDIFCANSKELTFRSNFVANHNSLNVTRIQGSFTEKRSEKCDFIKHCDCYSSKNCVPNRYCNSCSLCSSIMSFKTTDTLSEKNSNFANHYPRGHIFSVSELKLMDTKELQTIVKDLSHSAEKISSDLVEVLLQNDTLHQEIDARNVAIEQLLELTVKNAEAESRPIQMSVILPSEEK